MHLRNRAPGSCAGRPTCSPCRAGGERLQSRALPANGTSPALDFARIGDDIQTTTFEWALGVFILVEGALLYAIFRFRGKPDDPEPRQTHGNTTIEIIWTVIPALILAAIAVPTVEAIFETNDVSTGDALKVEVVGHQWWWEFRYPDLNHTANEIHVPVGRTVALRDDHRGRGPQLLAPPVRRKTRRLSQPGDPLWFKAERRVIIRRSARSSAASSTAAWGTASSR